MPSCLHRDPGPQGLPPAPFPSLTKILQKGDVAETTSRTTRPGKRLHFANLNMDNSKMVIVDLPIKNGDFP